MQYHIKEIEIAFNMTELTVQQETDKTLLEIILKSELFFLTKCPDIDFKQNPKNIFQQLLNPIESNISKQTIFQSCNIGVVASKLFNLQSINIDIIIDRFHLILASEPFSIIIALFRKIKDITSFTRLIDNISIEVIAQVANEIISPLNDNQIVKEQDKDFQCYFHRILEYICAHEMETFIKLSTLHEIFPIENQFEQFMHYIENIDLIKLYCLICSIIRQNKIVNFVQSSIAKSFSFSNEDLKVGINNENFEINDVEFTKFSKISRYLMDYSYKIIINVKKGDVNFIFQKQIMQNHYGSECDLELNDLSATIILQNDTSSYLLQWIRFRCHLTQSFKEIIDFIPAVQFIDSYFTFLNNTILTITMDKFEMICNRNLDSVVYENSYKFKIIQLKAFQKDFEKKKEKTLIDTIDHELSTDSKITKDLNNVLTCHITISSLNKAYIMSIDHAQFLFTNNSIFEFASLLFQSGLDINREFIFNNCAIFMNTTEKEGYIIGTQNIKFNIPAEIQDQSQILSDEKEIKRVYHDIKLYHRNNNQSLSKISNNFTIIFEKNNDSKSSTLIIPQLNIMELMTNSYFEATKKFDSIADYSKYFLGNFFF